MRSAFKCAEIKQVRTKHSLSQEQLANLLGVAHSTLHAWESGKRLPQPKVQQMILSLGQEDSVLPHAGFEYRPYESNGFQKTGAGFISSILDYKNKKDPLPFTHSVGRWYGSLPSFLVRDLVNFIYADYKLRDKALVNFSGSGTVALEFGLAGIACEAIDINPASILLSYIKTHPIVATPERLERFMGALQSKGGAAKDSSMQFFSEKNLLVDSNKWISPHIRDEFLNIISLVNKESHSALQLVIAAALTNIAIDYCNIDKRCTNHYVYRQNSKSREALHAHLKNEALNILDGLGKLREHKDFIEPNISLGNNTALPFEDNSFGAVFSHPPYSNMINYFSVSRIQNSIIELLKIKLIENKILPSSHQMDWVQQHDMSSGTLEKFQENTKQWISEAYRVLKKSGVLLVIIGDSRKNGNLLHPQTEIVAHAESLGMSLKETFIWVTNHKAGMHVQRKGHHIDHSYVLVLQK